MPQCACGCGTELTPYKHSKPWRGVVKGEYPRWLGAHHWRVKRQEREIPKGPSCACGCGLETGRKRDGSFCLCRSGHYKRLIQPKSYRTVPGAGSKGYAHRARAERALGHPLPPKAVVHHADGTRSESSPLVICQDAAYHRLLHTRMRVKAAGGNPNTDMICYGCHRVVPIAAFHRRKKYGWYCDECKRRALARLEAKRAS